MITMMMTLMMMMAIKIGGSVDDVVEEEVRSGRASFLGSLNESSDDKVTTMVESCGTMTSKESTNAGSHRSTLHAGCSWSVRHPQEDKYQEGRKL